MTTISERRSGIERRAEDARKLQEATNVIESLLAAYSISESALARTLAARWLEAQQAH